MPGENVGWGTVLAVLTGAAFVTFTTYKITRRRAELRERVELLGAKNEAFARDLERMIRNGELKPVGPPVAEMP